MPIAIFVELLKHVDMRVVLDLIKSPLQNLQLSKQIYLKKDYGSHLVLDMVRVLIRKIVILKSLHHGVPQSLVFLRQENIADLVHIESLVTIFIEVRYNILSFLWSRMSWSLWS